MKNKEKTELKGGEIAEEKVKNGENLNEDIKKEGEMAKKKSSSICPKGSCRSSGGSCRKPKRAKTSSRRIWR